MADPLTFLALASLLLLLVAGAGVARLAYISGYERGVEDSIEALGDAEPGDGVVLTMADLSDAILSRARVGVPLVEVAEKQDRMRGRRA